MEKLEITLLKIDTVEPNPWNPNVQNDTQYKAEIESITTNGFLAPILTRQVGDKWQIIDGEHRLRAMKEIIEKGIKGEKNIPALVKAREIPAIVIEADDPTAKKLTIIMNETRGRADFAKLGALLAEIKIDLPDDHLGIGLPYTDVQINELLDIADFDWSSLDAPVSASEMENGTGEESQEGVVTIVAALDAETADEWRSLMNDFRDDLPKEPKAAAGAMIARLIAKSN